MSLHDVFRGVWRAYLWTLAAHVLVITIFGAAAMPGVWGTLVFFMALVGLALMVPALLLAFAAFYGLRALNLRFHAVLAPVLSTIGALAVLWWSDGMLDLALAAYGVGVGILTGATFWLSAVGWVWAAEIAP